MSAGFLRFPTTNTHTLRRSADNRNLALQINWQLMAVTSPLLQISPPMGWRSLRNVHYAEIFNAQFMLIFLYFSRCYVVIKRTEKIKNTTTSANAVSQSASHRAYFYGSALVHIDSYVVPDFFHIDQESFSNLPSMSVLVLLLVFVRDVVRIFGFTGEAIKGWHCVWCVLRFSLVTF